MKRRLLNITAVLSLLLLLATVGLWVDGYWNLSFVTWNADDYGMTVVSHGDSLLFSLVDGPDSEIMGLTSGRYASKHILSMKFLLGFGFTNEHGWAGHFRQVRLPHWFPALIFAILPTIWLFKWNKRRKLGPNACSSCGYDLTGNESGVCSECGAAITSTN